MPSCPKKPCSICRHWFYPDARIGSRQRVCSQPECQKSRRQQTQANWRAAHPDYPADYRLLRRKQQERPEPLRLTAPLNRLPWQVAKDEFGSQGADFLGLMGTLLIRTAKDQMRSYVLESTTLSGPLPPSVEKDQSPAEGILKPEHRASHDAIGISSTGAALGALARAPSAPAAAADSVTG